MYLEGVFDVYFLNQLTPIFGEDTDMVERSALTSQQKEREVASECWTGLDPDLGTCVL